MSVTISVTFRRETDKAILVEHGGTDIWLPKSQVESTVYGPIGSTADIDITDWIAEQKDLTTSAVERYVVEQSLNAPDWAVKDTNTNPVRIMCLCSNPRDANIICASLEMTKNKL